MQDRPCTREDLYVICPQYNRWTVDDEGDPGTLAYHGDDDGDAEEYVCDNCGEYFTPDGHNRAAFDIAWQAALDHLSNQEAA